MKVASVCFALLLGMFGTAVYGQSYAREVWNQLQNGYERVQDSDFILNNYIIGKLSQGAKDSWTFPMDAGREYLIVGACDRDCADMDLFVKDARGNVIVKDTETDDIPITRFRVNTTGRFTIEIEMYKCTEAPCFFGFGLFRK